MATLYNLTANYDKLLQLMQDGDIDPQALSDTLASIDDAIEDKADGYAKIIADLKGQSDVIKAESQRLRERAQSIDNNIKWLKKRLQDAMEQTGKTKFKTPYFSFGIQNNPPSVDLVDETKLPVSYLTHVDEWYPDKAKIKEALKGGKEVPGAILKQGQSLRIR
ncbi:siphovirus Gp157 family protein [Lacticaseibacillus saniviri]